jgi:inner membrane transporter RhtA
VTQRARLVPDRRQADCGVAGFLAGGGVPRGGLGEQGAALARRVGSAWPGLSGLSCSFVVAAAAAATAPFAAPAVLPRLDAAVLAAGIGLALLVPLLPYALEPVAPRTVPPRLFGVLVAMEPVIGAVFGLCCWGCFSPQPRSWRSAW